MPLGAFIANDLLQNTASNSMHLPCVMNTQWLKLNERFESHQARLDVSSE